MARPRGRNKTARVTVNLDDRAYSTLLAIADHEDAPVAQVARRAIMDFLAREGASLNQLRLPLVHSAAGELERRSDDRRVS